MSILEYIELEFKCPNCGKDHNLKVSERKGIVEWRCLSDGIYRSSDCCGYSFILKWNIILGSEYKNNITINYDINIISDIVFQHTKCAICLEDKHTPLRSDKMGGYVCLTCINKELNRL
jgi:hypothetical protein